MKTTGFRSIVLYLLLFAFIGGIVFFVVSLFMNGDRWAMQPYNGHLYAGGSVKLGDITDKDGALLATTKSGNRVYSENEDTRRALLHTVGDSSGYISTSVQYTMRSKLAGYNVITGINPIANYFSNNNIKLTVDADVCTAAYNALGSRNGAVMVYNYLTGDIVCKVSKPAFDPMNVPDDIEENSSYAGVYLDNNLSSSYTPGSIFKIVTSAAAMDKFTSDWDTKNFYCEGSVEIGGSNVTCMNYHGEQNMSKALGNSCNIYFAYLANEIGAEKLQEKAEDMSFNREISFGKIPCAESKIDLTKANENQLAWAGVGQYTILTNPYHMMVLMGAIANNGEYVEPRLTTDSSVLSSLGSSNDKKLLSADQAVELKKLMRNTVENYYGDYLFPDGMQVCAKTGTGEVGEGIGPNCWMVGFSQNSSTPYAFVVIVENGAGGIETAGNVASAVMRAVSNEF